MFEHLSESISLLARELHEGREQRKNEFEWLRSHAGLATKLDLKEMEKTIMSQVQDAIDALNTLSTASDGLSVKVDKLVADTGALIAALGSATLTPVQQAALDKAKASATAAAAEGDKVDAAVAAADAVLPTPAPAAPAA